MKIKKLAPILALTLCATAFSGCTGDQRVSFNSYWQQNSLVKEAINETLQYSVSFKEDNGLAKIGYGLSYDNGVYTTNLVSSEENGKVVYTYTTVFSITVTYTLGTQSESFTDSIVSVSKFYDAENALRPIYSEKAIVSHSPTSSGSKAELDDCYQAFEYKAVTTYDAEGKSGTSVVTKKDNAPMEKSFEIDEKNYRYLDNESLLLAVRGLSSSTSSAKVMAYSPFAGSVQKISLTFATEASESFSFLKNGVESTQNITYRPLSIVLGEENPGATQTAWIAKTTDAANNVNRNMILKLQTPLSYSLGTLTYLLTSVTYA